MEGTLALARRIGFTRFSRWGENLGRLTVFAATHKEALDGTDELTITCAEKLEKGERIVWFDRQGACHEHIVDEPEHAHEDEGKPRTTATCIGSIAELWDDYVEDKRPSGSEHEALTSLLDGTRWQVGTCDLHATASHTFYHISTREAISDLLDTWGGELEVTYAADRTGVTTRKIGVRALRGDQDSPKRFTWTKDLKSIKRKVASDNPKTRIYCYGKGVETESGGYGRRLTIADVNDGLDYVEDAEATDIWGHPDGKGGKLPAVGVYVNEQCEDATQLKAEGIEYLDEVKEPKVSYEANVLDLVPFGRSWEGVSLGDCVAIIDKGFSDEGVRLKGRVSQLERDLLDEDDTKVTFGNIQDTMTDMWASVSAALKGQSQRSATYDAVAARSPGWLQSLQASLNEQFQATGTYKVETFELGTIYSNVELDPETGQPLKQASNMWAVNLNGRGIRLASKLDSQGEWDWRTFITGEGATADEINTGTLNANLIRTGILEVTNGEDTLLYVDFDSGIVRFSAYSTTEQMNAAIEASAKGIYAQFSNYVTTTTYTEDLTNLYTDAKSYADGVGDSAAQTAKDFTMNTLNASYSTTAKMNAAIKASAEAITLEVEGSKIHWCNCTTAGATQVKVCTHANFTKYVGATVCVKFSYANTASSPKLTVQNASSGATETATGYIYVNNAIMSSDYYWKAQDTMTLVWDGTYWRVSDGYTRSAVEVLRNSITLSVTSATGGKASIKLSVDGEEQTASTNVVTSARTSFQNESTNCTISAGTITFNSNTFVVNSTYFKVSSTGVITATSGTIGGFTISSASISNGLMTLNSSGTHFYYNRKYVGKIGTNCLTSDSSKRGIVFDLEYSAAYTCWAWKESSDATSYTTKLTYSAKSTSDWGADTLNIQCVSDFHCYKSKNVRIDTNTGGASGGISGTMRFTCITNVKSDGSFTYSNGCFMTFKYGFLVKSAANWD